jgi:drug/metabolite transporter (DMT)-like permease
MSPSVSTADRVPSTRPDRPRSPVLSLLAINSAPSVRRGILIIVLAITMFSTLDVISKFLSRDMSVIQIIWIRFLLFVPISLALAYSPGNGFAWRSKRPFLQTARSLTLVVQMWLFLTAFAALPLADVHAIGSSAPLMVTALSVLLLGESVGWRRWIAVAVGFGGVLLIVRPGFAELRLPMLYVLCGATMWAFYQVSLKILGRVDSAATTGIWTAGVGAIATTFVGPFVWTTPDGIGWVLLLAAGLLGGVGHIVYSRAFVLAPASILQPFNYLMLVYAALFGWIFFGDVPDRWTVAGAALVVGSGLYTFHRARVRAAERTGA